MVELLAILNTELNASLLELRRVRLQQEQDWDALDNLQAILNEQDQVPRTVWPTSSSLRHEDPHTALSWAKQGSDRRKKINVIRNLVARLDH